MSFFKYGYEATGEILWDGVSLSCNGEGPQCLSNGEEVLSQSFEETGIVTSVVILLSMIVGIRIFTYIALRRLTSNRGKRSS